MLQSCTVVATNRANSHPDRTAVATQSPAPTVYLQPLYNSHPRLWKWVQMFQVHGVRQGAAAGGAVVQSQAGAVHTAAPLPAGWRQRRLWPGGDKRRGAGAPGAGLAHRALRALQGSAVLPEIATGGASRPPPSDVAELGSRAAAPSNAATGTGRKICTPNHGSIGTQAYFVPAAWARCASPEHQARSRRHAPAGCAHYGALFAAHLRAVGPAARLFPPRGTYFKRHLASTLSAPGPRFSPPTRSS